MMAAAPRFGSFELLITQSGPQIKTSLVTPGTWRAEEAIKRSLIS